MPHDLNKRRAIASLMVKTHFREPWQWRLEVDGYPYDDFDLFVREVAYGPIEIETEQVKAGVTTLTFPSGAQPVTVSMTVRDHVDQRVSNWFSQRVAKMVNSDGTVNLPVDYLLKIRRFAIDHENKETRKEVWEVLPTQMGDITESKDGEGLLEFPITFIQFRST